MHTPKSRARSLRGALVGVSSTVVTAGAHAAAGGGVPRGPALVIAILLCLTVGVLFSGVRLRGARCGFLATVAALCAAQFLGHLTLVAAGHHHGGFTPGWSMAAAHLGAAVLLGAAIAAVEYLYAVCLSVLCWLRLFTLRAPRALPQVVRRAANVVVRRQVPAAGLGMRAPPRTVATV